MKQVCHLIAAICTALVQLGTHALGQQQWRHEKLLSQVYDVAASPQDVWINSRGDVAYFASLSWSSPYTDAYRNRNNVSEWLGPGRITSLTHGISENGDVLFRAGWRSSQGRMGIGLYVNDNTWWEQVYSGGQYMQLLVAEGGVDNEGMPVYILREDKPGGNYYLYQGHRLVQDSILSGKTWIGMPKVNGAGQIAWHGKGDETGGKSQAFLDDYPLSRSIVGPDYSAAAAYLNRRGDVLWTCPDLDGYTDIFINEVNYSRSHFGNAPRNYHAYARGMNDNGDIVWAGIDWNLAYGYPDVFKNHENLSMAVYGDIPRAAFPMGISNTGQAVWIGFREGLEFKNTIWRDTTNISAPLALPPMHRRLTTGGASCGGRTARSSTAGCGPSWTRWTSRRMRSATTCGTTPAKA